MINDWHLLLMFYQFSINEPITNITMNLLNI